jgi:tetratricopeptide (TPR) repeat protein
MGIVAAASLAGMAVTSTLAVTAIHARDAASEQRRAAEGLVSFMLGDLRDKLEPIGRLDALDAVGSRALGYFESQDKGSLSDAALSQRSQALSMLGEIATARGDTAGALQRYREAMAGTAEMIRRSPDDPQRLFDHAQNVFYVGEIALNAGKLGQAEASMREYRRLATRMVSLDPNNPKWRMEAKYADANLGIVLFEQRRYAEASATLQTAMATAESLAAGDPNNSEYQKSVPESLAWLGDSLFAEGRVDEAIGKRERQVALLEALRHRFPLDVDYRQREIPARQALGRWLASEGAFGPGLQQARAAVQTGQALIPTEPDNMKWVQYTAGAQFDLAKILLANRSAQEAAEQTRGGCDLSERLSGRNSNDAASRLLPFECLNMRAQVADADGSTDEAISLASRALSAARMLRTGDPVDDRYVLAFAYRVLGNIENRSGDAEAARQAWQTALATMPTGFNESPRQLMMRAELLGALGRTEEAKPLRQRLSAIGYRFLL